MMQKGKIVLIEDNPHHAELIQRTFTQHEVETISSLNEMYAHPMEGISAIICDYKLSPGTAIDVFSNLKERNIILPVIVVSCILPPEEKERILSMGFMAFFTKSEAWKIPKVIEQIISNFWERERSIQAKRTELELIISKISR